MTTPDIAGLIEELESASWKHGAETTAVLLRRAAAALAASAAREQAMREQMERIANLTERWTDSLVSQVNEIARAALSNRSDT